MLSVNGKRKINTCQNAYFGRNGLSVAAVCILLNRNIVNSTMFAKIGVLNFKNIYYIVVHIGKCFDIMPKYQFVFNIHLKHHRICINILNSFVSQSILPNIFSGFLSIRYYSEKLQEIKKKKKYLPKLSTRKCH